MHLLQALFVQDLCSTHWPDMWSYENLMQSVCTVCKCAPSQKQQEAESPAGSCLQGSSCKEKHSGGLAMETLPFVEVRFLLSQDTVSQPLHAAKQRPESKFCLSEFGGAGCRLPCLAARTTASAKEGESSFKRWVLRT